MFRDDDIKQNVKDAVKSAKSSIKKVIGYGVAGIAALVILINSTYTVDGGEIAIEQTPSGKLIAQMDPGIKFKYPFLSKVFFYNEVTTVTYDEKNSGATSDNQPYPIIFADTYGGKIKGTFRIEMPRNPDEFRELHKAFKRYDNFVDNGVEKFTNELLAYTANQYTGEAFMQGGQNEFKARLMDQAQGGLYITKRTAVRVKRQAGIVGLKEDKASQTTATEQVIFKNIIQRDKNGKPLRNPNPMKKYGVKVTQVTIDGFLPEPQLKTFMDNKKKRIQERATLRENQENEKQKAVVAKLRGDRERVEAKQQMLKEKDAAVIEADKRVALESKAAELQIVRKKKELAIAKANEGIQKANAKAAKYQAQAIKEKGLAEASVISAKYKARDPKLYALEKQVEVTNNLKSAMQGITVQMPRVQINGSGDGKGATNSIDVVMQAIGIQKLEELTKAIK